MLVKAPFSHFPFLNDYPELFTVKPRKHWTKTPAGKKLLKEKKQAKSNGDLPHNVESIIAYATGYTKAWLEAYANGSGIPQRLLTKRVGQALRS